MQRTPPSKLANKHLPPPQPIATSSPSTAPSSVTISALETNLAQVIEQNKQLKEQVERIQEKFDGAEDELKSTKENLTIAGKRWKLEKTEWRRVYDAAQFVHNVAHLDTALLWHNERVAACLTKDDLRRNQIAIIMREHKLSLFQAQERELKNQHLVLEDQLDESQHIARRMQNLADRELTEVMELKEQLETVQAQLDDALADQEYHKKDVSEQSVAREALQAETYELKKELGNTKRKHELQVSQLEASKEQKAADRAKIEKLQTQLDKTTADLKSKETELKRASRADARDDEQVAELSKEKIELQLKIRELESKLKKGGQGSEDSDKDLRKSQKKVDSLEKEMQALQDQLEKAIDEAKVAKRAAKDAERISARAQKDLDNSHAELERLRSESGRRSHTESPGKGKVGKASKDNDSPAVRRKASGKPLAAKTPKQRLFPAEVEDFTADLENVPSESEPSSTAPAKVQGKKRRADEAANERQTVITPPAARPRPRPKPKAKKKPSEESDEEIQEIQPTKPKASKLNPRSTSEQPKTGRSAPASTGNRGPKAKGNAITVAVSDDDDDDDPKPKKKRKIGGVLGVGANPWNMAVTGDVGAEFGIPGNLSPVKGGSAKPNSGVPARSNFKPGKALF